MMNIILDVGNVMIDFKPRVFLGGAVQRAGISG